jgi:hypothetical protein
VSNLQYRLIVEEFVDKFNAAVEKSIEEGFQMHESGMVLIPGSAKEPSYFSMQMIKLPMMSEPAPKEEINGKILRH